MKIIHFFVFCRRMVLSAILVLAAIVSSRAAETEKMLFFSNLGLEDGLSQVSVMKICQDSKGYMWFGTRNGLNRYDGTRIKVYKQDRMDSESLADNFICALSQQGDSLLWIGTMRGLNRMDLRSERMSRVAPSQITVPVRGICIDSRGMIWIGTQHGLFLSTDGGDTFVLCDKFGMSAKTYFMDICELSDGRMALCSENQGIFIIDRALETCEHLCQEHIQPMDGINSIFEDSAGRLWISTHNSGLVCMEESGRRDFNSNNSELTTNDIRCCIEADDILYVGTADGLYLIDGMHLSPAKTSRTTGSLSHFSIYSMCQDSCGGLWIGTYSGGVDYCNALLYRFRFHNISAFSDGVTGPVVPSKVPGQLYIGTEGGGLLEYDIETENKAAYLYDASNSHGRNIIKSLYEEGDVIWCGTRQGSIYQFNTRTKSFTEKYQIAPNVPIYGIRKDGDGNLYCITSKPGMGFVKVKPSSEIQNVFRIAGKDVKFTSVKCMDSFDEDRLLLGTGSNGLYLFNTRAGRIDHYGSDEDKSNYLPSDYVSSIAKDSKGYSWIGLSGYGIALLGKDAVIEKTLGIQEGLANDEVSSLVIDRQDNLWIASHGFISKYDPVVGRFHNYRVSTMQEFTPNCGTLLENGDVSFSAGNGFITFDPDGLKTNTYPPSVVLTELSINNEVIVPGDGSPLELSLDDTQVLRLRHNQNDLVISYCAMNFLHPDQNSYAYRLVGHDEKWNYVGNRNEAYFTKLNPGHYTFQVRAANNDGVWNEQERSLQIVIRPSLWATWYAFLLYGILLMTLLVSFLHFHNSKKLLEQELRFKQKEQKQQEEFHKQKMRMYTNFSHELRTPLMLITSPLEELMSSNEINPEVKNRLGLIYNNSQRLSILVDQLLDLRKSQSGKMKMKVSEGDICLYLDEICCAFRQVASSKGISLVFNMKDGHLNAWYDPFLLEKMVFNLLSNAIKSTPENGRIDLILNRVGPEAVSAEHSNASLAGLPPGTQFVEIIVSDTGTGIPEGEIEHIFEPFYQAGDGSYSGTGIGLSLTLSIVQMHHGVIWAENNAGPGACFHVVFPSLKSIYTADELDVVQEDSLPKDIAGPMAISDDFSMDKRYTVLLVEDDKPVRSYVKECLEKYFDVIEADNGNTAWQLACEKYPDIVVSDVMMPMKDGLELCRQLKEDIRTGHIPVILMTAKSMAVHVMAGFETGADDYIVKPFNMGILMIRIRNLLLSRERLKKLFGMNTAGAEGSSAPEDPFTHRFYDIIEQNISNPELDIDMICREIGMSRTNLYRKLKAITDLSPVELIRGKRLKVAAGMLESTSNSIFDIATYTGFNSLAYFSSCFKTYFSCTPTEYKEKHRKK